MANNPNILVLLRETCDPRPPVRLTPDGFSVRERGLRRIANPADLCALEQGLQLAESQKGAVTVVAIGPPRLDDALRLGLSMGAQRAIRVWDSGFKGGDSHADARLLERVMEILQPDYFLTGQRLADRGADPAPALASARLGIPCVSGALSFASFDGEVEALRKCDRGARQMVGTSTPCCLLVAEGSSELRYPDQQALMTALQQSIETWGFADLGLPMHAAGAPAALLGKERCSFPRPNPRRVVTPDASLPAFERILALLSGGLKPREGKQHLLSAEQTVEQLLKIFAAEGLLGRSES
jgi:electron transfer flavoprotein beta subunit